MRILFIIQNLGRGGAERVVEIISQHFAQEGLEVHILPLEPTSVTYPLHPRVKLLPPLSPQAYKDWRLPYYVWMLRNRLQMLRPDRVLTFLLRANFLGLLTQKICGFPCSISEHADTGEVMDRMGWKRPFVEGLLRWLYPTAQAVIVVSQGVRTSLMRHGVPSEKIVVIYNPVRSVDAVEPEGATKRILTMGRLSVEKNQALVVRACAPLLEKHAARLELIGDGPERERLQGLCRSLAIEKHVTFHGWVLHPTELLQGGTIFAFSSDYEGFGNAIVEAMSCGLPVVVTDCRSGPREILADGEFGLLCPVGNVEHFRDSLEFLLQNPEARQRFRELALKRSRDFLAPNVGQDYLRALGLGHWSRTKENHSDHRDC